MDKYFQLIEEIATEMWIRGGSNKPATPERLVRVVKSLQESRTNIKFLKKPLQDQFDVGLEFDFIVRCWIASIEENHKAQFLNDKLI